MSGIAFHGDYHDAVAEAARRECPILIMFEAPG